VSGRRLPAAGLLLAGGGSRRMGRDKLFLPWGEGTLLEQVAGVLCQTLAETWLVGFPEAHPPPRLPGLRFVSEATPVGPLGGLLAGLEAITRPVGVVVAADMPFVSPEAIRRLWKFSGEAPATVPRTADGVHPLFGVYRRECLPAIRFCLDRGDRRMVGFWPGTDVRLLEAAGDPCWARALFNINSPADYEQALRMRDHPTGQR